MSNCTIADKVGYWSGDGTFIGTQSVIVYAVPDLSSRRYQDDLSAFRPLGVNPAIAGNDAFKLGRQVVTDNTGSFSFALPYATASTHPSAAPAPVWTIVLPDGKMLTGIVPDLAGPFSLDDLASANGTSVAPWVWANQVYVAPVTPGTLVRGVAPFSAGQSLPIVFAGPFVGGSYVIKLTPSVDSNTGQIPSVGYSAKSASGFTINISEVFTGTVDWEASL